MFYQWINNGVRNCCPYALRPTLFIVVVDGSIRIVILIFFDFVLPVSLSELVKTHINQIWIYESSPQTLYRMAVSGNLRACMFVSSRNLWFIIFRFVLWSSLAVRRIACAHLGGQMLPHRPTPSLTVIRSCSTSGQSFGGLLYAFLIICVETFLEAFLYTFWMIVLTTFSNTFL